MFPNFDDTFLVSIVSELNIDTIIFGQEQSLTKVLLTACVQFNWVLGSCLAVVRIVNSVYF